MAFLGMRGSGDWGPEERPTNYRQGILLLYPNGSAPLTGLLSKMSDEKVDDPQFTWWTKTLPSQRGSVTGIFRNTNLTSVYGGGGVVGTTVFVKMSAEDASQFKNTHEVLLRLSTNLNLDTVGKVTTVVTNGANSYLGVRLLEIDDNGGAVNLSSIDTANVIGNINSEGGPMPDAVAYDPVKYRNFIQTFRTSLSISRIARLTKLRTEDAYKEAKRESLELHSIEIEKAMFWGIPTENIGPNGKPERTTQGLISFIKENVPGNVSNYMIDAESAGMDWLVGGESWFDRMLELVFRYGSMEKLAFCGSGAMLGINKMAKASGHIDLTPMTTSYGMEVIKWLTPFGALYLKTHPLFSFEAATRNAMVILEPKELRYRFIEDTHFVEDDGKHGAARLDGTNEEWITDCGMELHFPPKFMFLSGFNQKNTLAA